MTQIALDPDAAVRTVEQLRHVNNVVNAHRGNVVRSPAGLPAALASSVIAEQNAILSGLDAGRGATDRIAGTLAHRTALFVAAGGGSVSPSLWRKIMRYAQGQDVVGWGKFVIGLKGKFDLAVNITKTGIMAIGQISRKLKHVKPYSWPSMERWLKSSKSPMHGVFRSISRFQNKFEKTLTSKVLKGLNIASAFHDAYSKSSAKTGVGRAVSAALSAGVETISSFAKLTPGTAVFSWVMDDAVKGSLDAITVVVEESYFAVFDQDRLGSSSERFSDDAQAGKHGWWMQAWNAEAELLTAAGAAFGGETGLMDQWTEEARTGKHGGIIQTINAEGELLSAAGWGLFTGDTSYVDQWSDEARNGKHGPVMTGLQKSGDWLGGAIYDVFN